MKKDIAFKELIKEIAKDIAQYLLKIEITDEIELIDKEFTRVEKREADLVFKHKNEIFHIEIQNQNHKEMNLRMLRYLSDIAFLYPEKQIHQYVIYIGKQKLKMLNSYRNIGIDYNYNLIDIKSVNCEEFLNLNKPEAVVLAVLCDFKDRDKKEIVPKIVEKIYQLSKTKDEFLKNIEILTILSTNRNLEDEVEKGVEMIRNVELRKLPFFRDGLREGRKEGLKQGLQQGLQEGLQQGLQEGLIKGKIFAYQEFGLNTKEISNKLNIPEEKIISILEGKQ